MIDVLIIGSGIAGLTAAINASNNNSKVLVLSKNFPTHSQSVQALDSFSLRVVSCRTYFLHLQLICSISREAKRGELCYWPT